MTQEDKSWLARLVYLAVVAVINKGASDINNLYKHGEQ